MSDITAFYGKANKKRINGLNKKYDIDYIRYFIYRLERILLPDYNGYRSDLILILITRICSSFGKLEI